MSRHHLRLTVFLSLLSLCLVDTLRVDGADPLDWPHWRGLEMNGISREKGLPDSWSPEGENLIWASKELATRSTPIIMNGMLYVQARLNPLSHEEGEQVICADAATGEIKWQNKFNVYLSDVPDTRVAWSSVTGDPETGNIYAQGVCGLFLCIDGQTGQTLWSRSLHEQFGLLTTYGGRTNTPTIAGDLVIASGVFIGWGEKARPQDHLLAFDKRNGQPVWFSGTRPLPEDTTYSSPVLGIADGTPLLMFGSGDGGVHAFQPQTGLPVWKYEVSARGINTTPVVVGNMLIGGHSEENLDSSEMGALFALKLDGRGDLNATGGEIWRNREQFIGKSSPLVVDGRIYAIDDSGSFFVVDQATGKTIAKEKLGTQGRGSPLYVDGKIYCCEGNGRWYIFKITPEGLERIHRLRLDGEVNGSPVCSHGRIYIPTGEGMYCIGLKDHKPEAVPVADLPKEADVSTDTTPAQVQVVPVESLLKCGPGGQRQLHHVRLYNSRGQYLRTCKPDEIQFSISGPGTVDAEGRYTTPVERAHSAVIVTAKVGELTGTARIRINPDLPWSFDFSKEIPVTFVGARYRHIPLDFDLYKKLEGKSELLSRMYIFIQSEFVNFGPTRVWDDTTPAQRWTEFRRFANLLDSVKTLDESRAAVDPLLTDLKAEGIVAEWTWEDLGEGGTRLTIKRGERGIEGNGVMCKITTIPKGTRSQGWMGRDDLANYTIQADVYNAERDGRLGDAGVTGQRYRLELMGASQELKIVSWISHESKFKAVPFEWKSNTWYTLKFKASTEEKDGRLVSVLAGKCWPRDGKEPEEWTVTWEDYPANETGAPGLSGSAKDSEVFFDNVKVYEN